MVSPLRCPERTDTAPNSPMALAEHSTIPYSRAQRMWGSVICENIWNPFAPMRAAASSSSLPAAVRTGMISLDMKGNVTNIVARTIPGTANMICIPSYSRYGYRKLCLPNVSTNIRPAMIGDMVSGRSMSVDMIFLPRKVNLVMSHAA